MAKERLSMRKIREILRLKYECHLTDRQIAKSCLVARSTVASYLSRAKSAGLKWPLDENLSDTDIYNRIYESRGNRSGTKRNMPPMDYIHNELKKKGEMGDEMGDVRAERNGGRSGFGTLISL